MNLHAIANHTSQRGAAAVELAMILGFTFFVLPVAFLFGRVLYHYSVIKQATQDAALYLASLPTIEVNTAAGMNAAKARASQMVTDAISAAGITPPDGLDVLIFCDGVGCVPTAQPAQFQVWASYTIFDGFSNYTYEYLPDPESTSYSWAFSAGSTARNLN